MAKVISIVNQKGGVGKTTSAINIATAFAAIRKKILLIDLDPQGNASTGLGIETAERNNNIYNVLSEQISLNDAILKTKISQLDIITATVDLSAAELELVNQSKREYLLKDKLNIVQNKYDFIIIDCPPSLGLLTINALVASNDIIIPLQCEFFALEGLAHLLRTTKIIQQNFNPNLQIMGILLTMYDRRNRVTEAVEQDVRSCLEDLVFNTVIPRNSKLSEAPSHGLPALIYDHKCSGSQAYAYLVREILDKESIFNKYKSNYEEVV